MKNVIEFAGTNLEVVHTQDAKQWYMTVEDVARAYGVERTAIMNVITRHRDEIREDLEIDAVTICDTIGRHQETRVIYRDGVIKLGYFMRGERAKAFRQFATDLVVQHLEQTGQNNPTGFQEFMKVLDKRFEKIEQDFNKFEGICRGIRDEVDELKAVLMLITTEDDEKTLRDRIQRLKATFNCDGRAVVAKVKALCNKNKIYGPANIKEVINLCNNLLGFGVFGDVNK
jgi:prophage antirepressor-like protein